MKKLAAYLIIIIGLCIYGSYVYALEDKEVTEVKDVGDLSREKKTFRNYTGQGSTSVSSFCMEGLVFVMVSGDISNAQSIIQVYEDRNGRVVPKRCSKYN
jgi:arginase family enzyme